MRCALIKIRARYTRDGYEVISREVVKVIEDKEMLLDKVARLLADDLGKAGICSEEGSFYRPSKGLCSVSENHAKVVNS